MAQIVPSILTDSCTDAQHQLDQLADVVPWVQIDFMDGAFVENKSITAAESYQLVTDISLEAHLMVQDPAAWWTQLDPERFKRIYIHIEAVPDPEDMIKDMREEGYLVGLANNIETPVESFSDYVDMVDNVLFMSVIPGQQGQTFHPEVLDKIRLFGNQFPDHQIAIDGGVTAELIPAIVSSGVDDIGVGSVLSRSENVVQTLHTLEQQLT